MGKSVYNKIFKLICVICLILISILLNSCNDTNKKDNFENITIKITEDYGKREIKSITVPYEKNRTVLDIMVKYFEIETLYGGSFIKSINNIASKTEVGENRGKDWFYHINREEANIGAAEYIVKPNDEIWWDFREWDLQSLIENN